MNIDIRLVAAALRKTWAECTAVNPALSLRDRLQFYETAQFKVVSSGVVKSTSANNQHTTFDTSGQGGPTSAQAVTIYGYLIEQFDRAVSELGGQPTDLQVEQKMETYLRPVTGWTSNWMYLMKCLALSSILLSTGCQVIPTDMFPKVKWYWSKDAEQYRADKKANNPEKHQ